ncbi:MAG TPA: CatB-related O-acetyltransferase [Tepidisphaeraceae bacterium]|nr:CatB-related O-acetyltransferase [Tepidisphaeraceae bacterium]
MRSLNGNAIQIMSGSMLDAECAVNGYTYIGYNCCVTKATIGRYCSIANNVTIGAGEHFLDRFSTSSLFYDDAYQVLTRDPCVIGSDVWIGVDTIIRRGITVGDGAVVGANSFVNADVPPFAVVAGSPARLIRYRFSADVITAIIESHWWDLEIDGARASLRKLEERVNSVHLKSVR